MRNETLNKARPGLMEFYDLGKGTGRDRTGRALCWTAGMLMIWTMTAIDIANALTLLTLGSVIVTLIQAGRKEQSFVFMIAGGMALMILTQWLMAHESDILAIDDVIVRTLIFAFMFVSAIVSVIFGCLMCIPLLILYAILVIEVWLVENSVLCEWIARLMISGMIGYVIWVWIAPPLWTAAQYLLAGTIGSAAQRLSERRAAGHFELGQPRMADGEVTARFRDRSHLIWSIMCALAAAAALALPYLHLWITGGRTP